MGGRLCHRHEESSRIEASHCSPGCQKNDPRFFGTDYRADEDHNTGFHTLLFGSSFFTLTRDEWLADGNEEIANKNSSVHNWKQEGF